MAEQTVSLQSQDARCEHFMLPPNGWVPNNTRLPVLVWRGAIDPKAADLRRRVSKPCSRRTAGRRNGATASSTITISIRPRMRRSALHRATPN